MLMESLLLVSFRMLATRKSFEYSVFGPTQLSHARFRGVVRSADPALQILKVRMKAVLFAFTARHLVDDFVHGRIRQNFIQLSPIQGRESLSESLARFCFERCQRTYKIPLVLFVVHPQQQIDESVYLCLLRARNNPLR